jgi:hypothetical protein
VAVQQHVHIGRHTIGRNVHQSKPHAVSFQVDHQRPFRIAVAISADDRHRQPDVLDRIQDARVADIAKMPDFIRVFRQCLDVRRQMIVGVG